MVRRLRGRQPQRMGRLKRFFRRATLTAGIMLGCASLSGQPAVAGTLGPRNPPKPIKKCDISKTLTAMPMNMWFGLSSWSIFGMSVIGFPNRQTAMVDYIGSMLISPPRSKELVMSKLRLRGVRMPALQAMILNNACLVYNPYKAYEKDTKVCKAKAARDDSKKIAHMLNRRKAINLEVASALSTYSFVQMTTVLPLDIIQADAKSFVLGVRRGAHAGKRVVLDRRVDILVVQMAGVNAPPNVKDPEKLVSYRISSLSSDKNGNLKVKLKLASKTAAVYNF